MKRKQVKILGVALLATLTLAGCGSQSSKADSSKDKVKVESTQKKEKQKTQDTSADDPYHNDLENYSSYKSINDGKSAEEVYTSFVEGVKNNPQYGQDPMQNQNLTIILYKPDCPDCKEAEDTITSNVRNSILSAPLQMSANMKVKDYKYNVVSVDISKDVPQWIKDINGLDDGDGQYHTPTIAVVTPKKLQEGLQWDVMSLYTGTDADQIKKTFNYYVIENASAYQSFMNSQVNYDPQKAVK